MQLPIGCANRGSALPSPSSNVTLPEWKWGHVRRAVKRWILLLSLSLPETLPAFFSLPYSQVQPIKQFSGIKMFQNLLQEKKHSKIMQTCHKRQWDWLRDRVTLGLGRTLPAASAGPWMPSRGRRILRSPPSRVWHWNSGNVESDNNHFSAFTFSRTH